MIYHALGRKGIEPLTALAIEFTAQPIIPTNGAFLFFYYYATYNNRKAIIKANNPVASEKANPNIA